MHNLRCIGDSVTKLKAAVCRLQRVYFVVTRSRILSYWDSESFFDQIMFVSIGALVDDFVRVGLGDAGQSE